MISNDLLWFKETIFYEVYVRAFADSNGDGIGDLPGLTGRLDYLQDLGVECIWLLPISPSPLRDDGYDVADFTGIHPDYGTLDDLRRLVDQAHRRGIRVVTDLVLNHTSDQNPWFQASRDPSHPDHARYRDWYVWSPTDRRYQETRIIFLDTERSNWSWDPLRGEYYWHRFFHHQPDLNYDHPAVRQAMLNVVRFWLDQGIDGFRVDAVPYLYEREGTSCENLPETHAYLKHLRAFVDQHAPGTLLLSEANQWPEETRDYLGDGDEFHMSFHFPLMPRIFLALAQADSRPIRQILARTPPIPDSCQWGTFLRCHDELTLEMVSEEERHFLWDHYAPEPRMRLNLGIRRRLAPLLSGWEDGDHRLDRARVELAYSLLFSLPGSPFLYYGDEIGMGDNIWLEDRGGVRTPMQWSDAANAGFSTAEPGKLFSPVIDDRPYGYRSLNVQAQQADPGSLLNRVREMIRVRKAHPALGRGNCTFLGPPGGAVHASSRTVLAYLRTCGDETILVANNLSSVPQSAELDLADYANRPASDLFTGAVIAVGEKGTPLAGRLHLQLRPGEYCWRLL